MEQISKLLQFLDFIRREGMVEFTMLGQEIIRAKILHGTISGTVFLLLVPICAYSWYLLEDKDELSVHLARVWIAIAGYAFLLISIYQFNSALRAYNCPRLVVMEVVLGR